MATLDVKIPHPYLTTLAVRAATGDVRSSYEDHGGVDAAEQHVGPRRLEDAKEQAMEYYILADSKL